MPADLRTLSAGGGSGAPFDDELGYEPEDGSTPLIGSFRSEETAVGLRRKSCSAVKELSASRLEAPGYESRYGAVA